MTMGSKRGVATLLALMTMMAWGAEARAQDKLVGVGLGFYSDDGQLNGTERVAVQAPRRQDRAFDSVNRAAFSLWGLKSFSPKLRAGGALRYYGGYATRDQVPDDTPDDQLPDAYGFGTWIDLTGQVEWHTPIALDGKLQFVLGGQLGLTVLLPGDEFEAEIERLQEQNVGVWGVPRVGFHFGPQVGVRFQLIELVAVRVDLGLRYNRVALFSTSEEVDGVAFSKDWDLNILRQDATLGVEIAF